MKPNPVETGKRIKHIRKKLVMTMEQFAILTDSSNTSAVNNWERGYNLPNKLKLKKLLYWEILRLTGLNGEH